MFCKLMMSIMQCTGRFFFFFFLELVNTNPISGLFLKFSEEEVCGERPENVMQVRDLFLPD